MRDVCVISTYSSTDANPVATHVYSASPIRCRYSWVRPLEVIIGQGRDSLLGNTKIAKTEAQIRVPPGTTVSSPARVKLTKRDGATLSPALVYEVIGEPRLTEGGAELILNVSLIEGNSAL